MNFLAASAERKLHRGELDRVLGDPEHAAVHPLEEIELVADRGRDLRAEHQVVAAGRRGATGAAGRLDLGQRRRPEVEPDVAELERVAARECRFGDPVPLTSVPFRLA